MICPACNGNGGLRGGFGEPLICGDCMGSGIASCCDAAGSASLPSFTCPRCGAISYNPNDVRERYCGRCHVFVDEAAEHERAEARRDPRQRALFHRDAAGSILDDGLEALDRAEKERAEAAQRLYAQSLYRDDTFLERLCDRCGKPYRGPAVYCSLACAVADA